jgi:hypothetical protein
MNREEAEEYAKNMTYRDAVYNALQGKCIPYRKATLIKLYELLDKLEQEPCDVFDEYGNYKYPSDVELTEPNTATSMPCEDAISRQAVLDLCDSKDPDYKVIHFKEDVECLPPVAPQLKTGHR